MREAPSMHLQFCALPIAIQRTVVLTEFDSLGLSVRPGVRPLCCGVLECERQAASSAPWVLEASGMTQRTALSTPSCFDATRLVRIGFKPPDRGHKTR